jgi:hypothetical protein
MPKLTPTLLPIALLGALSAVPAPACVAHEEALDAGYRQMYNLDFATAHQTFHAWQQSHPQDPIGFVSDGAAYIFAEFARLHILESELFTDDDKFRTRQKLSPDAAAKEAFEADLRRADQLSAQILLRSPQDQGALFAQILIDGLRGDYLALIEKRNFASLGYMKNSRTIAETLLALDPECYDAYLASGVENYLLGANPAPVRWILRITGARTDKDAGLAKLRLTAAKGYYLAPFARLLLAVAALRDKDKGAARILLSGLTREFPRNPLYARELARLSP